MINRNYETSEQMGYGPDGILLSDWAASRETAIEIAVAIHAISSPKLGRTADEIWESPTHAEYDHVVMAVNEYYTCGDFPYDAFPVWGLETLNL